MWLVVSGLVVLPIDARKGTSLHKLQNFMNHQSYSRKHGVINRENKKETNHIVLIPNKKILAQDDYNVNACLNLLHVREYIL